MLKKQKLVNIPENLYRRLRSVAQESKKNETQIMIEALDVYLRDFEEDCIKKSIMEHVTPMIEEWKTGQD